MDLTGIRKAVADSARTVDGLEDCKHWDSGTQASPAFWVEVENVRSTTMGRPWFTVTLRGRLQIVGTYDRSNSEHADRLVDEVWLALESDRTLGGLAQDIEVMNADLEQDPTTDAVLVSYEIVVETT